jgi:hypothetical protein
MSYLYYDCLKNYTEWQVNLPLEVVEFMGIKLRDAIEQKMSKEKVGKIYDEMEKDVGLLFLKNKIFCELYLNNYDVSDEFKNLFIESFQTFNIKKIKNNTSIFVKPNFLDMFFTYLFPHIKKKFYLFTGSSDYSIDEKYESYLNNGKIIKWIGHNITLQHSKIIKIPIGFSNTLGTNKELLNTLEHSIIPWDQKENKLLITHMDVTSVSEEAVKYRKNAVQIFENKSWVNKIEKCDLQSYLNHINNHKFILCPKGNGIDTFRFWETVFLGSIPIIESDSLDDLYEKVPCIIVENFNEITETFLNNYKKDPQIDNRIYLKYENYVK